MKPDHPKSYWFKRRRYGWGYVPVTWQGGLSLIVFLAVLFAAILLLPHDNTRSDIGSVALFLVIVALDTAALITISIIKGPTPHWRWGKKPHDNPDEDF